MLQQCNIVNINARAGLEMRGWVSNDLEALRLLPVNLLAETGVSTNVNLGKTSNVVPLVRVLGLIWEPPSDVIGFNNPEKSNQICLPNRVTKRVVLSLIMRVFDPLGILAPIVISGRIMFQDVWRMNLDWDAELPQTDVAAWNDWFRDLTTSSQLKIPRRYSLIETVSRAIELHVFADASEQAYSAVAYFRFIYPNDHIQLSLVCSKSRVAPLKPTSIPRLELQAALIAARLARTVVEATRFTISKRVFWCDSMNVLGWLRNDARRYKPFVAHRIGEIIELTDVSEWQWVPSHHNVADDATRRKRGPLTLDSRWLTGPQFLCSSDWPTEPAMMPVTLELKPIRKIVEQSHLIVNNDHFIPLCPKVDRFSSWSRLLRSTAFAHYYLSTLRIRVLRKKGHHVDHSNKVENLIFSFTPQTNVASRHRNYNNGPRSTLSADDLRLAEIHVLIKCQLDSFPEEVRCVRNGQPISPRSRLSKLPAFLDKNGLLRLSSRIAAVPDVEDATKFPILLDGKHHAVRLLVLHHHRKTAHANNETVVNEIRQAYWIISLRNTDRAVAHSCQFCRIRRAVPCQPIMGDLPEARLAHYRRPFSFVGLDYFGPMTVAVGRRTEKRYVALYTCLSVRAIHLEVVNSLSTDAAIMALRRFVARRGTPSEIYSDNGTAFVGANRQLKSLYENAILEYSADERIRWKFIPPSAPFMGGAWERLIRSVKTALKTSLGSRTPTDEILITLLCEVEAIVNSRPLTHVPTNHEDQEALTPFHFIFGTSSGRPIPASLSSSDHCSRIGWRRAVLMADAFWQRWLKEYLPTLSPRRLRGERPNVNIDDVVIIADSTLPRGSWPKGRITAVYPGRDGVVRVVDIETRTGVLRRPLKKLIILPV